MSEIAIRKWSYVDNLASLLWDSLRYPQGQNVQQHTVDRTSSTWWTDMYVLLVDRTVDDPLEGEEGSRGSPRPNRV